ncbi:MAG TPA: hypothetical protein DCQ26_14015 [Marinilabiliales bacterium]|nr:MAG: hypothetical protein A2W84_06180 [Bacteroidetes bacterium GWC2_40_13]OFX71687.1 MAG: hypothetical protein A2W96_09940 [Bacteroidetes bacterium GWD2_40_43]OFX90226.1 MAG: hypothetical protein A2W97_17125 [Bacteroidetes bacterium GWE2_40_63]OFY18628.1 MAG: hypothetical protein A2W88_05140 [Bacteroidetes bacterium GWF2_40_13]HAM99717.1 hypothetical protein [Marinilabiliales bacterium]
MKRIGIYIIATVMVGLGCSRDKLKRDLLPGVSGSAGEVVIVMEPSVWSSETGKNFRALLTEETPGLPQSEPLLNPVSISMKAFTELFKIHRNLIIAQISPSIEKRGIQVEYNKWAKPQLVITMLAPNRQSFDSLFMENEQKILGLLLKAERDRLIQNYENYPELTLIRRIEKNAGLKLTIPKGYSYDMDTINFHWIALETPDISQGLFIYYYDYTDSSTFTANYLIEKRNEFLKKFVSSQAPGSYMTTELQVFPVFRSFELNGKYTAELRGLWKMENDFMGGPFVSISQLDPYRNRVVTVEGFVYAPKFNKRNYIRQLEAILYSLQIVDPKQADKK